MVIHFQLIEETKAGQAFSFHKQNFQVH